MLRKALYRLKQALCALYECLAEYFTRNGYTRGVSDKTLFIKKSGATMMIAWIYVDGILFGGMSRVMVEHFVQHMQFEFETSMVGRWHLSLTKKVCQEHFDEVWPRE